MRTFKTAWFARAARKAHIKDSELCEAIEEVMKGQAVDLGGGVFKKRLNRNQHRSIILARGGGNGFTNICSRKRIAPTLTSPSWKIFVRSRKAMRR
jgi:hypothetical protein